MTQLDLVTLRPDQNESIEKLRANVRDGAVRQVLSAPTGSGKTECAKHLIASAWQKGSRALFVVDRLSLLEQTTRRFYESGLEHGVMGGGGSYGLERPIIVSTAQTLSRIPGPELVAYLNSFDIIFHDEVHVGYRKLTEAYLASETQLIGLTATPMARGMGKVFERLVSVTTTNALLEAGHLTPIVVRSSVEIDMNGAPIGSNGEWAAETVQDRGRKIIGDIVSTWVEETHKFFGGPVKTMLFAASIAHGEELCQQFQAAGYDFRQVSAGDDGEDRNQTMQAYRHGEFPGIVSCEVLSRGIDIPDALCLVIARPYRKAFMAHIQMLGRIMRKAEGKKIGLVLDFAGNSLGFYHETEKFFAEGVDSLDSKKYTNVQRAEKPPHDARCKGCQTVLPPMTEVCPVCGLEKRRISDVETVSGTMITIDPLSKGKRGWEGTEAELWSACCTAAAKFQARKGNYDDQGKTERQAKAHFHELTGKWPPRQYTFLPGSHVPKAIDRVLAKKRREWRAKQQGKAA